MENINKFTKDELQTIYRVKQDVCKECSKLLDTFQRQLLISILNLNYGVRLEQNLKREKKNNTEL